MFTARQRIERQKASPALIRLHRALGRLQSTLSVMNTGAHPDDEQSGMLAWLRFGLGMRVIVACSTRGEGGQNALGPERGGALGMMRSREMEEAAKVLDCDVSWLGHGPDDPVHDFGFSKDGDQTFEHWDEMRIVERLVRSYRCEKPDIVIPTFLDVPGQHGHHRAMTRAAEKALVMAADRNAFPEHLADGLTPWQVAKYYLPAWSGGGDTYDDETPPPATTLTIRAQGRDVATGADYDRIGEWSRYYHASQGMGYWPELPKTEWPLHLLRQTGKSRSEASILDNLPCTLEALAQSTGLPNAIMHGLTDAQDAIDHAVSAFPDRDAIIACLVEAVKKIEAVCAQAPAAFLELHGHRLQLKIRQIDAALIDAAAIFDQAFLEPPVLSPGATAVLTINSAHDSSRYKTRIEPVLTGDLVAKPVTAPITDYQFEVTAGPDAAYSPIYTPFWSALGGNGEIYVKVRVSFSGHLASANYDLEEPFAILPASSVTLTPDALIVPLSEQPQQVWPIAISVDGRQHPVHFSSNQGWSVEHKDGGVFVQAAAKLEAGRFDLVPQIEGKAGLRLSMIAYPHMGRITYRQPEILQVLALDLTLPKGARIGYIGAGADRVGLWLARMGLDVTELEPHHLSGDLQQFTTIVVGIFAFGLRQDLAAATSKLHQFVENGGHLLTLYHRPSDGWNQHTTPPKPVTIGSPSLRWRVTDPAAEVTVLAPEHRLLTGPNRIGPDDWEAWDKERGLYFASHWDDAYQPLLSMHDANEQPLMGALISAEIGKGRHTHTSLVLHHQLDRLVPGAFRLLANLVQPA